MTATMMTIIRIHQTSTVCTAANTTTINTKSSVSSNSWSTFDYFTTSENSFSVGVPENELIYSLWNVTHAKPHVPSAGDFQYGFRDDIEERFRWLKKVWVTQSLLKTTFLTPFQLWWQRLTLFQGTFWWRQPPWWRSPSIRSKSSWWRGAFGADWSSRLHWASSCLGATRPWYVANIWFCLFESHFWNTEQLWVSNLTFKILKFLEIQHNLLDNRARYGICYARSTIRVAAHAFEAHGLVFIILLENDPTRVCRRRPKMQASCRLLKCYLCHLTSLVLSSCSIYHGLGCTAQLVCLNLPLHDRCHITTRNSGICGPNDVDWTTFDACPEG